MDATLSGFIDKLDFSFPSTFPTVSEFTFPGLMLYMIKCELFYYSHIDEVIIIIIKSKKNLISFPIDIILGTPE